MITLQRKKTWKCYQIFYKAYLYDWLLSFPYSTLEDFDLVTATLFVPLFIMILLCNWLFLALKFALNGELPGKSDLCPTYRAANPKWLAKLGWCSLSLRLSWSNWSLDTGFILFNNGLSSFKCWWRLWWLWVVELLLGDAVATTNDGAVVVPLFTTTGWDSLEVASDEDVAALVLVLLVLFWCSILPPSWWWWFFRLPKPELESEQELPELERWIAPSLLISMVRTTPDEEDGWSVILELLDDFFKCFLLKSEL